MDQLNALLFFGGVVLLTAIFAGSASSRFGAPLLLVFLALGVLIGEDGVIGLEFNDFRTGYVVGSAALAIVLFDGGMRTHFSDIKLAAAPALSLSTIGVLVTTGIVAAALHWLTRLPWTQSALVGATIASTDAAAVFFLLNQRGMQIHERVRATLEVESGVNDPMAVFLVVTLVHVIERGGVHDWAPLALSFFWEMAGGALVGALAGWLIVQAINRLELAPGLYAIVALAGALAVFGGAQLAHASGFLAVYVAGLMVGNLRHRGQQLIVRFHDGLAWLSQIVMFLMLGLLVTPHELVRNLPIALLAAVVLIVVARPVAVFLSLTPLRFEWRESAFISWVGLRGAVPIFLATIPLLGGLPGSELYFHVAFVVVVTSLTLQGWTIGVAGTRLRLELPKPTEEPGRLELDFAGDGDRDIFGYRVGRESAALEHEFAELPLPRRTRILSVIRDGTVMNREGLKRLAVDDRILLVAPSVESLALDRLFAARIERDDDLDAVFGEFTIYGASKLRDVALMYGIEAPKDRLDLSVDDYMRLMIRRRVVVGDRLRVGPVELVVREMAGQKVMSVGLELDPDVHPFFSFTRVPKRWRRMRAWVRWLMRRYAS